MSEEKKQEETAVAVSGGFGSLPAIPEPTTVAPGAVPYLGFYDRRSSRAPEITGSCPTIKDGEAYLGVGMLYQQIENHPVIFAACSQVFYCQYNEGDWVEPVKVATHEFEGGKEEVVTAGMVLVDDSVYPFVASFRTTKVAPAKVAFNVAQATEKPGWAKNKVQEGLMKLPPMLRHYGELTSTQKTGKFGPYYVARWIPQPLTVELAKTVMDWLKTPEPEVINEEFKKRVAELQAKVSGKAKEA